MSQFVFESSEMSENRWVKNRMFILCLIFFWIQVRWYKLAAYLGRTGNHCAPISHWACSNMSFAIGVGEFSLDMYLACGPLQSLLLQMPSISEVHHPKGEAIAHQPYPLPGDWSHTGIEVLPSNSLSVSFSACSFLPVCIQMQASQGKSMGPGCWDALNIHFLKE